MAIQEVFSYKALDFFLFLQYSSDLKPDMARYEEEKALMGDDFYADLGTAAILPGRLKDSEEAKSRLVASVNAQIEKVKCL